MNARVRCGDCGEPSGTICHRVYRGERLGQLCEKCYGIAYARRERDAWPKCERCGADSNGRTYCEECAIAIFVRGEKPGRR